MIFYMIYRENEEFALLFWSSWWDLRSLLSGSPAHSMKSVREPCHEHPCSVRFPICQDFFLPCCFSMNKIVHFRICATVSQHHYTRPAQLIGSGVICSQVVVHYTQLCLSMLPSTVGGFLQCFCSCVAWVDLRDTIACTCVVVGQSHRGSVGHEA